VEIRLFGEFTIRVGDTWVPHWQTGKARSLFQYLLLERGRPVTRCVLEEALWPEMAVGSSSLRVTAHTLRRQLTAVGAEMAEALKLETTNGGGYRLSTDGVWVDALAFDDTVSEAGAARRAGQEGKALGLYREAVAAYEGDLLLEEEESPWLELRRHGLRSTVLAALEAQLLAALQHDDGPEVVQLARTILEIEPHREGAYRALIVQHGRMGQPGQADRWFELCSRQLDQNLGVRPEPRTYQLHRRAVRGDFERGPSRSPHRRPRVRR
jgi:two-component SAPR family response regulator